MASQNSSSGSSPPLDRIPWNGPPVMQLHAALEATRQVPPRHVRFSAYNSEYSPPNTDEETPRSEDERRRYPTLEVEPAGQRVKKAARDTKAAEPAKYERLAAQKAAADREATGKVVFEKKRTAERNSTAVQLTEETKKKAAEKKSVQRAAARLREAERFKLDVEKAAAEQVAAHQKAMAERETAIWKKVSKTRRRIRALGRSATQKNEVKRRAECLADKTAEHVKEEAERTAAESLAAERTAYMEMALLDTKAKDQEIIAIRKDIVEEVAKNETKLYIRPSCSKSGEIELRNKWEGIRDLYLEPKASDRISDSPKSSKQNTRKSRAEKGNSGQVFRFLVESTKSREEATLENSAKAKSKHESNDPFADCWGYVISWDEGGQVKKEGRGKDNKAKRESKRKAKERRKRENSGSQEYGKFSSAIYDGDAKRSGGKHRGKHSSRTMGVLEWLAIS